MVPQLHPSCPRNKWLLLPGFIRRFLVNHAFLFITLRLWNSSKHTYTGSPSNLASTLRLRPSTEVFNCSSLTKWTTKLPDCWIPYWPLQGVPWCKVIKLINDSILVMGRRYFPWRWIFKLSNITIINESYSTTLQDYDYRRRCDILTSS